MDLQCADQHSASPAFVYVVDAPTTYLNRLAFTPVTQYKGRSSKPPTTEAPGYQQVAIVIITPPLQVSESSVLVLIIIHRFDLEVCWSGNWLLDSLVTVVEPEEGCAVVEEERVVKLTRKKGCGERTQKR